ncbi:uncharacterized protein LOC111607963 [Xiphophorus maculatus]|uniref:uncharacterized protein LOC111607963 n=1 Tax=Xiphophorus maculatus TaxID=8083 RepID=UPI000C6E5FF0|nr:uncharacterized protein LOC111607963 [Xiphophorus maculatus]
MKKSNKFMPPAVKTSHSKSDHDYSVPMESAAASKREREASTPTSTPEKNTHMEKRTKGTSQDQMNTEAILSAISSLGQKLDDRMEEVGMQIKQHSAMLAAIAKSVQLNSEELNDCKKKIIELEKQVDTLSKENVQLKGGVLNSERYKRRWSLRIKGKKEKSGENIRDEVVALLCKIAPDLASKMDEEVDVVHRVGRKMHDRDRQIIILFVRRALRDDIWKRTKTSPVCKEEGVRFSEDLTPEDWKARQAMWPKIEKARKEGKAAGFRGPFGFIEGKRIMDISSAEN